MALAKRSIISGGNQPDYSAWGNQAEAAAKQGFYPESSWDNNGTVYRSNYTPAFNNVLINNKPDGHIAFIGYPNKTFDIVIRDKTGNIVHTIDKNVSPDYVQNYITNASSTVAQRNNSILKHATPIVVAAK